MKKSHVVGLTLLGVWAAALARCGGHQECVDRNNVVISDQACRQASSGARWFYTYNSPGGVGSHIDASTGTTRGVFGGAGDAAGHGGGEAGE